MQLHWPWYNAQWLLELAVRMAIYYMHRVPSHCAHHCIDLVFVTLAPHTLHLVSDDVRQNIAQRTGNQWWAERLVPMMPGDRETLPRARMLQNTLQRQWNGFAPQSQVTASALLLCRLCPICPSAVESSRIASRNQFSAVRALTYICRRGVIKPM